MSQTVMQEVNMDVFARRIAPYFSWLESRIESGWTQSEHITKDVLKETKMLSTNMRARFILGVGRDDFVHEVQRALELFDLAADAFPEECDEIESKSESLVKGIAEELGPQFLPGQTSIVVEKPKVPKVEEAVKVEKSVEIAVQKVEKPQTQKIEKPKVEKVAPKVEVKKVAVKKQVKKAKPKVEKTEKPKAAKPEPKITKKEFKMPKIKMPELPKLPKVNLPKVKIPSLPKFKISKKSVRNFAPIKWVREFIFGED